MYRQVPMPMAKQWQMLNTNAAGKYTSKRMENYQNGILINYQAKIFKIPEFT
jgi:hypothetical protein